MNNKFLRSVLVFCFATIMISETTFANPFRFKRPSGSPQGSPSTNLSPAPAAQGQQPTSSAPEPSASKGLPADSAIVPGTYESVSLGTGGGHAQDPGSTGPLTIFSDGRVSGTLYNYNDNSSDTVSGTVDLRTGEGRVTVRSSNAGNAENYTIKIKTTTKQYSFLEGDYQKLNSASRGKFWGLKQTQ